MHLERSSSSCLDTTAERGIYTGLSAIRDVDNLPRPQTPISSSRQGRSKSTRAAQNMTLGTDVTDCASPVMFSKTLGPDDRTSSTATAVSSVYSRAHTPILRCPVPCVLDLPVTWPAVAPLASFQCRTNPQLRHIRCPTQCLWERSSLRQSQRRPSRPAQRSIPQVDSSTRPHPAPGFHSTNTHFPRPTSHPTPQTSPSGPSGFRSLSTKLALAGHSPL